jgi:hypothetical protein
MKYRHRVYCATLNIILIDSKNKLYEIENKTDCYLVFRDKKEAEESAKIIINQTLEVV